MEYKVFVTRKIPGPGLELLKEKCHIEVNPYDRILTKEEIIKGLNGKDGLLCLLTDTIDREIISSNPDLKVISNYAAGYNNIDIPFATKKKIPVTNTPNVLTETTADLTWALILSTTRRIVEGDRLTREGKFKGWGPEFMLGKDVWGKTLGIIGAGRIGQAVAKRASGFNMEILYANRTRLSEEKEKELNIKFTSLDIVLKKADFLTLHIPLTDKTRHLIGKNELEMMKKDAFLINTARGDIIDEQALLDALKNNVISGAGLDVYEKEPEITRGLTELTNVVLLPHIGSATTETRTRMALMAAKNLIDGLDGKIPENIVNRELYL